jgi:hypothetical protein
MVKQGLIRLCVAVFPFAVLAPSSAWAQEAGANPPVLGVREFMKNVEKYPGRVSVEGVVSGIFPKQKMLALIDIQEFQECRVVTCAQLTLPVRWKGEMPKISGVVRVDGEVRREGNQRFFFAQNLKSIKKKL